jgi:hypothetical protein
VGYVDDVGDGLKICVSVGAHERYFFCPRQVNLGETSLEVVPRHVLAIDLYRGRLIFGRPDHLVTTVLSTTD